MPNPLRVLTLCGFLLATVLGFSNAQAALFFNGTGACLDVKNGNTANFTPVQAYHCHADFPQQWDFEGLQVRGIGTSSAGNKCLDVKFGGTADGTIVDLYDCHPGPIQQWYYYNSQLINLNSGKCLDVGNGADSTQAIIKTCNGSAGQQWSIRS